MYSIMALLVLFHLLSHEAHALLAPKTVAHYSNSTVAPQALPAFTDSPVCCFAVQDSVVMEYPMLVTSIIFAEPATFTVTNVTIYVTPYANNVTKSRNESTVYTSTGYGALVTASNTFIDFPSNEAPGPTEIISPIISTATPQHIPPVASFIYSTIKIITADPVTNAQNQLVCGTPPPRSDYLANFTQINSKAQAYFGENAITDVIETQVSVISASTRTESIYDLNGNTFDLYVGTDIAASTDYSTEYVDSAGTTINLQAPKPSGVVLSLTTPFTFSPDYTGLTVDSELYGVYTWCNYDGPEAYGYVPQALLSSVAADPHYQAQYPGLSSCLPAGPSVIGPPDNCVTSVYSSADAGDNILPRRGLPPDLYVVIFLTVIQPGGSITSTTTVTVSPTDDIVSGAAVTQIGNDDARPRPLVAGTNDGTTTISSTITLSPSPVQAPNFGPNAAATTVAGVQVPENNPTTTSTTTAGPAQVPENHDNLTTTSTASPSVVKVPENGPTQTMESVPTPTGIIIGSQTLTAGGVVTAAGQTVSFPSTTGPVAVIVGTQTLNQGGAITAGSETISFPSGGASIDILGPSTTGIGGAILSIGGFNPLPASDILSLETGASTTYAIIGTQTLSQGAVITTGGETLSLALASQGTTSSLVVVVGGSQTLTQGGVITAGGETISFASPSQTSVFVPAVVIGTQTLTQGGVITASGETISLISGGSSVVVVSGNKTATEALTSFITGSGGYPTSILEFTGSATRLKGGQNLCYVLGSVLLALGMRLLVTQMIL